MIKPRILIVLTSNAAMGEGGKPTGLWFEELTTPYYAFVDAGADVTLASIAGGPVPIDPRSTADGTPIPDSAQRFLADDEALGDLANTVEVGAVDVSAYDAVFLPGGHGTMWDLPTSAALATALNRAWRGDKIIGAVCHGPAGLIGALDEEGNPLVAGKRVTAFTNDEETAVGLTEQVPFLLETRLEELGALFESAEPFAPFAIADGRLITGQNPASSGEVAQLMIDAMQQASTVW